MPNSLWGACSGYFSAAFLLKICLLIICMQAVNGDRVPESSFRPEHGGLSFIYDAKLRAFHQSFQIISGVFRDIPFWFRSFPRQGRGSSLKWQ